MTTYNRDIPISQTPYRNTKVSMDKSQTEVRGLLRKYGVNDVQNTVRSGGLLSLVFARPDPVGHLNVYRIEVQALTKDEQGERQAARMFYWWMKAKLETISFGIADFETEMLPYQLISGEQGEQTVAEAVLPQLSAGATDIDPFRPALPSGGVQSALASGNKDSR